MHKINLPSKHKRSAPKRPPPKGVVPPQFANTVWQKGQSGNPGGAPKRATEVALLARSYTLDAIRTLASLMLDEKVKPRDRAYCADIILDRGLGKAPMTVKLEADDDAERGAPHGERQAAVANLDKVRQIVEVLAAAGALEQVIDARKRTPGALRDDEPIEIESRRVAEEPITSTAVRQV